MEPSFFPESEDDFSEAIEFYSESIAFELDQPALTVTWIENIIQREGQHLQHLSFIFCNDTYMHDLNVQYLEHDTLTDIITFHYAKPPDIEGDIFISIERVQENAQIYKVSFEDELYRVIAHGVLHLCGYGDKSPADKAKMTDKENEALQNWRSIRAFKS